MKIESALTVSNLSQIVELLDGNNFIKMKNTMNFRNTKTLLNNFLTLLIVSTLISCGNNKKLSLQDLKKGTFKIEDEPDVTIIRKGNLQIEKYDNGVEIDSFSIRWENDSIYTLKAIRPKTIIDTDVITYKIKELDKNGYTFESTIGTSNYVQKGRIYKK